MKKRHIISLVVVNAVVLAACGTGSESVSGPRVIVAGNAALASRDSATAEGGASDMPARAFGVTYEPDDGVLDQFDAADPGQTYPSWEFVSPGEPRAQLQRILDSLGSGLKGRVTAEPGNPGGYGAVTQDGPSFTSYGNELSRWWYYSAGGMGSTKVNSQICLPDGSYCGGPNTTVPPARNLLTVESATGLAALMLEEMGVDGSTLRMAGTKDAWGTSVNAVFVLDGADTPMVWNFTFGENGALTGAGGPVFTVRKGDRYPVISVSDAVKRLNTRFGFGWYASSSVSRGEAIPSPVDPSTDITVTLRSVRISTMAYWSGTGQLLMLPAYVFGTNNFGNVEVLAVPDRFIVEPDVAVPSPTDTGVVRPGGTGGSSGGSTGSGSGSVEPVPAPVAPSGTPTPESARKLVGLSEPEAAKVADAAGWVLRVTRRDGTDLDVTMDWNLQRVNVAVVNKTVTDVLSIG